MWDASRKQKYWPLTDDRKLNEGIVEYKYPLAKINHLLDELGLCQQFKTLDLALSFFQIEASPKDRKKQHSVLNTGIMSTIMRNSNELLAQFWDAISPMRYFLFI